MHIETGAVLALAVVGYAWIARIQAPAKIVNAVAWAFALIVTLVILITGVVVR
jgi:hypothetical protein